MINLINYVGEKEWYGTDYYSSATRVMYKSAAKIIEEGLKSKEGVIPYITKPSNTFQFLRIIDEFVEMEKSNKLTQLLSVRAEIEDDDEPLKTKTNRLTALNKKYDNEQDDTIKKIISTQIKELNEQIQEKKSVKIKLAEIDKEIEKLDKSIINTKTTDLNKQKSLVKNLVDDYAIPLVQQIMMDEKKEELDSHKTSYNEAYNLTLKMFNEVYEITDPELSAKQLLHSLINCKRGIYGMTRKEQTLFALIGGQGTGKSHFFYALDKVINGKETGSTRFENLIGRFTSSKMNENFFVFTEESPAFDRSQTSALKDLITTENYSYERKGKDAINMRKNAQMFICANDSLNNLFYLDGSSRRLSKVYMNGIKIKMSSESLENILRDIWYLVPVDFPYDTMDFVKSNNEYAAEETAWEDELSTLAEKYRTEINDLWLSKSHSRKEWMTILENRSIVRVENFLNKKEWFIKGNHNHMNTYKPTEEFSALIKEIADGDTE